MPTETLTATNSNATSWTGTGPWENTAAGSGSADYLEFTVPALTAGRQPLAVQVQATIDRISTADATVQAGLLLSGDRIDDQRRFPMSLATRQDAAEVRQWNSQPHIVADPDAVPERIVTWYRGAVENLVVRIWVTSGTVQVSNVQVVVSYASSPTVTIDDIHNVDTRNPDIEVTYLDPDNPLAKPASTAVLVIADGAVDSSGVAVGAAGFDPIRAAASVVPQSGAIGSFPATVGPLDIGTFWLYVRAAKQIGFENVWSPWVGQSFTTTGATLPAPDVTVTAEPAAGRVRIDVDADPANMFTYAQSTAIDLNLFLFENTDTHRLYDGSGSLPVLRDPRSLLVEQDASGVPWAVTTVEAVPVEAGGLYTADVHALRYQAPGAPATTISTQIALEFVAETGTRTAIARSLFVTDYRVVESFPSTPIETDTAADRHTVSGVAPAGATHARIRVWSPNASSGAFFLIDELGIYRGSAPSAWSPGEAPSRGVLPSEALVVERQGDGVWAPIVLHTIDDIDGTLTVFDRHPVAAATYRAYVTRHTARSEMSAVSPEVGVDLTSFWLHPLTGEDGALPVKATGHVVSTVRSQEVFDPIGRNRPVILTEGDKGEAGTLTLIASDETERDQVLEVLGRNGRLVLVDHVGQSWTVEVVGNPRRRHVRRLADSRARSRWEISFNWREVA